MQFVYEKVLKQILTANSVADAITWIQACEGIEHVTYHLVRNVHAMADNPFVRTTYPTEWVSYYLLNNLVASDPVIQHAAQTSGPFNWSEISLDPRTSATMASFQRFNLGGAGYSIPAADEHGRRSVLSFSSKLPQDDWAAFIAGNEDGLNRVAIDLHTKGLAEAFAESGEVPHLSPREYECLKWTSLGKSYSDIAIILSLSEHTVRSYLKMARVKLDSVTLAQAVAKASQIGLI